MGRQDEQAKNFLNGDRHLKNTKNTDVIIVGARVAGSALAYNLAKDACQVHVIERNLNEPNRFVGELLQPGDYLKLIDLGLEAPDCVIGIDAQKMLGYALFKDGKCIRLPYPLEAFHVDVAGRCFHHGCFVQKLCERAVSLPNVKLEQGTVTGLVKRGRTIKGVEYKTKSGREMTAYVPLIKVPPELRNAFISSVDNKGEIRAMPVSCMPAMPRRNPGAILLGDSGVK